MLEHEFILNYARTDPSPMGIGNGLNWQYILEQAKVHNTAPLLYSNIKNIPVPIPILKELEKIYTYTAYHNMLYLEEIQRILENINAIVLKGPGLATDVYGNIGLRPFADIDLLIKRSELDNLKKVLLSMGYTTRNEKFYKKYHFLMPFTKTGKIPIELDLQWELVDRFILHRIDMNRVWDGVKENKLLPNINILYLLLHIEKHAFFNKVIYDNGNPRDWIFRNPRGNRLIWFTDLYELIKKYNINLRELIRLGEEWHIQNIIYYNLYLLNKLYPTPILEDLPKPKLSQPKKIIYNIVLKKASFKLHHDIHLRPIRAVDLVNYLFPPLDYYCRTNPIPVMIIHILTGLREILKEFLGICYLKLSTNKKKGSPVVN